MKLQSSVLTAILFVTSFLGFGSKCHAGDNPFSSPDHIDKSDKVIVYKIRISDANSLRTGKLFHNYTIVAESSEIPFEMRTNLFEIFKRADPFIELNNKAFIAPCLFVPIIGISFEISGKKVDAVVSFDCQKIICFDDKSQISALEMSKIRSDLLVQLKTILPKDEELQSLK
ncbi:MAG: hypothetical protein ABSF60_06425 [Verrucomicrobiota bacterium]|jgi:hypothetical protein